MVGCAIAWRKLGDTEKVLGLLPLCKSGESLPQGVEEIPWAALWRFGNAEVNVASRDVSREPDHPPDVLFIEETG